MVLLKQCRRKTWITKEGCLLETFVKPVCLQRNPMLPCKADEFSLSLDMQHRRSLSLLLLSASCWSCEVICPTSHNRTLNKASTHCWGNLWFSTVYKITHATWLREVAADLAHFPIIAASEWEVYKEKNSIVWERLEFKAFLENQQENANNLKRDFLLIKTT